MTALEQVVDLELEERSSAEIAGAYRALCAAMLLRTALITGAKVPPRKVEIDQQATARKWVGGRVGLLSFEACCEAVNLEPEAARQAIQRYASGRGKASITTGRRPVSRLVFGRCPNAPCLRNDSPVGQDPAVCRVATDPADAAADCCGQAGS